MIPREREDDMKRTVVAFLAGAVLASAGIAGAHSSDTWVQNGVMCTKTGTGASRGVVCWLPGGHKSAVVNQQRIIVGTSSGRVLYFTSQR